MFQQFSSFPQLEELHMCGNRIADLSFNPALCPQLTSLKVAVLHHGLEEFVDCLLSSMRIVTLRPSLQTLDLENNEISSWQEVCRLQSLPALERLLLSGNKISSLSYPTPGTGTRPPA